MRGLRCLMMATLAGTIIVVPTAAAADGGAYIDLDRTHYLPGETAMGRTYVSIPEPKQDLLDRGPFYAFIVPSGTAVQEGRPIPAGAIRAGTFSITREKRTTFELRVSLTVPDLPGDFYSIAVCNDPCTISGFREALSGSISIVQTVREGQLLTEQSRLEGRMYSLRRDVRKTERAADELTAQLDASEAERTRLAGEVQRLEDERGAAVAAASTERQDARPLIDTRAAVALVIALLVLAGAVALRRRPTAIGIPDTIEELERGTERSAQR